MFCPDCGKYGCEKSHRGNRVKVNDTVTNQVKQGDRIKAIRRW